MAELKSHSAISELNKVHAKLGKAFLQKRAISADVARAEKMQDWLYKIKNLDTIEQIYLVYALYDQSERVINEINFSGCTNLKRITISGPFAIKSIITEL